ncbi:MAG TPA: hypothetical protein VLM80_06675 [Anaerolineales bacterium]|nr:hypothetical protein [Anaerolineales bacterium]
MAKSPPKPFRWLLNMIALIALVALIYFALSLRPQANDLQSLQERLQQLNIPVKSLTVTKQTPLEIELTLNSSGSVGRLSESDMLNRFLAVREVELAYLHYDLPVKSYRLMLVIPEGDVVYDSTIFLNDDLPSQDLKPAPPATVDDARAKEILENELDLNGLRLSSLAAFPDFSTWDNSKFFTLLLSTGASAENTNNLQIGQFIASLRHQIEDLNQLYAMRIVIMHVRIQDEDDRLLVDYLEDFEIGKQSSWDYVEGWYPQPAPAVGAEPRATFTPLPLPTSTPNPDPGTPLPTDAYPYPYP